MNLEELMAKGLTKEQAELVMTLHKAELDNKFIPKHRLDEVNTELKSAKAMITERDTQIAGLKKFEGDATALAKQVKEFETKNAENEKTYKQELLAEKKKNAIKLELISDAKSKPYDADMVLSLINLENVNVDDTGKLSGLSEQKEALLKEKAFLFKQEAKEDESKKNFKPFGFVPPEGDPQKTKTDKEKSSELGRMMAKTRLEQLGYKEEKKD